MRDLASPDPNVRMRAVQLLKEAAYPEAAVPLAKLVTDQDDNIQLEAIAAELNVFLAEKIIPRKRVGFVIEVRNKISAEAAFSAGPTALGPRPLPMAVLEALYAFGTLAVAADGPGDRDRRELLRASGPELAAMIGAPDPAFRFAALRVLERVFERRRQDDLIETNVGDAVITALNGKDRAIRVTAIRALGAMRYERAVQALTELYRYYGKGDVADAALDALARIAHPSSAPLFSAALAGKNSALKGTAIEGLARLGDKSHAGAVQASLAGERNEGVQLAGSFAAVLLNGGSLDPLTDKLRRPKLRDQAWQYLVEAAPGRTATFGPHAQDPDPRMRADIADILGVAGDPAALPIVEPMTKDRDALVALAAQRAVARLR
jgi:HEAT repeat protein